MKLQLSRPDSPYKTVIDVEHDVTITDPFVGPLLTHEGVNLTVFARDDGFEVCCWEGEPTQKDVGETFHFSVHPRRGVTILRPVVNEERS